MRDIMNPNVNGDTHVMLKYKIACLGYFIESFIMKNGKKSDLEKSLSIKKWQDIWSMI